LCMVSRRRVSPGLSLTGPRIGASEARSLAIEPSLEFGRVADEEPIKQRSTVHLQRPLEIGGVAGAFEIHCIAGQDVRSECNLVLATTLDEQLVQLPPKKSKGLAQCAACVRIIERRPEGGDEGVAP